MLRKADVKVLSGTAAQVVDPAVAKRWPTLFDYLTQTMWDDHKPRLTSTLLLTVEDGRWKARLQDRAFTRVAWLSADTALGLLEALEAALKGDSIDWRADKWAGKPAPRRS